MSTTKLRPVPNKRRALVTGAAGLIGSNLCARLHKDGFHIVAVDNLSTGNLQNLKPLMNRKGFEFVLHDVTVPMEFDGGYIFNFACCASPKHYQRDPEKTVRTCVDGALNVLHLAEACGARVLQASTSEVYGEPEVHPQRESYRGAVSTVGPRACYDEGKRCAETLFFDFHREYGLPIKVARIFNTYGPRMQIDDGRVVSNFIVQALRNEPLTVYGDGTQTRSFCYIDDMIEGLVTLMMSPPAFTGPVNLGNPAEVTMLELAERIIELTGSASRIVHRPLPVDDPTRRQPDISLAREALDWQPHISLDDGLRNTILWFDDLLNAVEPLRESGGVRA